MRRWWRRRRGRGTWHHHSIVLPTVDEDLCSLEVIERVDREDLGGLSCEEPESRWVDVLRLDHARVECDLDVIVGTPERTTREAGDPNCGGRV